MPKACDGRLVRYGVLDQSCTAGRAVRLYRHHGFEKQLAVEATAVRGRF